jgi:hypothetical protein
MKPCFSLLPTILLEYNAAALRVCTSILAYTGLKVDKLCLCSAIVKNGVLLRVLKQNRYDTIHALEIHPRIGPSSTGVICMEDHPANSRQYGELDQTAARIT